MQLSSTGVYSALPSSLFPAVLQLSVLDTLFVLLLKNFSKKAKLLSDWLLYQRLFTINNKSGELDFIGLP